MRRSVPVFTSSLMSSSFMRMVTDSSLIFCWACTRPWPSRLLRLSLTEEPPTLEWAAESPGDHRETVNTSVGRKGGGRKITYKEAHKDRVLDEEKVFPPY